MLILFIIFLFLFSEYSLFGINDYNLLNTVSFDLNDSPEKDNSSKQTFKQNVNRLPSKTISSSKVEGAYEAQNRSVLDIHEDSSIEATNKFAEEIELRKKSNDKNIISNLTKLNEEISNEQKLKIKSKEDLEQLLKNKPIAIFSLCPGDTPISDSTSRILANTIKSIIKKDYVNAKYKIAIGYFNGHYEISVIVTAESEIIDKLTKRIVKSYMQDCILSVTDGIAKLFWNDNFSTPIKILNLYEIYDFTLNTSINNDITIIFLDDQADNENKYLAFSFFA
jgi:hypothetical protein